MSIMKWSGMFFALAIMAGMAELCAGTYGDFQYEVAGDNINITGYTGDGGDVIIPGTINGKNVAIIGFFAFGHQTNLTSVMIPASVTVVGDGAFQYCTSMTAVYFAGDAPDHGTQPFGGSTFATIYRRAEAAGWPAVPNPWAGRPTAYWWDETVATPAFNPDGGTHPGTSVDVTLTCATAGATIRYTTDGSQPTESSDTVASGGTVTVPIPGTLKAKAWKDGMMPSAVKSAGYIASGDPDPDLGPSVRANGERGTVSVTHGQPVAITVTMAAGEYIGVNADWWLIAIPGYGHIWYYMNALMEWVEFPANELTALQPALQGPLLDVSEPVTVLPAMVLPPGIYFFYFAVDQRDGILNHPDGPMLVDSVTVVVE